ncbi:MAG: Fic family protein [Coriobacteriales bacterium]|jgi:Fic family protein
MDITLSGVIPNNVSGFVPKFSHMDIGRFYTPKLITKHPKLFSPGMLQLISKGERAFTRCDEHMASSPYLESVWNSQLNFESLSASLIDGAEIDLMELLSYDLMKPKDHDPSKRRIHSMTSQRAIEYHDYVETHNSCTDFHTFQFDRSSIMDLYSALNYKDDSSFSRSYRTESIGGDDLNGMIIAPDQIDEYMDDLLKFCNTSAYTPHIQASLVHFQLEYIRPFRHRTQSLGRQMAYIIYGKRDFTRHIFVASAIESIWRFNKPLENLKSAFDHSGKHNPLELWMYRSANMLIHQADKILEQERTFAEMEDSWRKRVPKIRRDDICDIMLHDLVAHPIVNAKYIAQRSGRTLPAANDALRKLIDAGVIAPIDQRKRNRFFYAVDYVDWFKEQAEHYIPRGWLPGNEIVIF